MKALKVIHGFPPDYMAGSEVYSYRLVKALSRKLDKITVFTGIENEFAEKYHVYDEVYNDIEVHRINKLRRDYAYQDKFYDEGVEADFRNYLSRTEPDVVHFGHLSHLSTRLLHIAAKEYQRPIVFTVHDFWLFCVKGQLIDQNNQICSGANAEKCHHCSPYQTTVEEVDQQLTYMRGILELIDIFLLPSHTLRNYFIQQDIPKEKLVFSRYGFDTGAIKCHKKIYHKRSPVNFGFMGRVIPSKGIRTLIEAFSGINAHLSIYGKIGNQRRFLEQENIQCKGSYDNDNIDHVLAEIDVLVVPSIWLENSPLVIQEAFLAGVPVITSDIGGMNELVTEGVNGFLFEKGCAESLQAVIERIVNNPELLNNLSISRNAVRCIEDDADFVYGIYKQVCSQ